MQNVNQFVQSQEKGSMDLARSVRVLSCQVGPAVSSPLLPGQAVKLIDSAGGAPKVEAVTADTDVVFGFVVRNMKDASFKAGQAVEIATGRDDVMFMESSAAVARGADLMVVVSGQRVAPATVGKRIVGYALDKAAGAGELIRVVIECPSRAVAE